MKQGDLVRIVPLNGEWCLNPGEADHCIFLGNVTAGELLEDWGDQDAGMCDCLVLWQGELTPFRADDLVPVRDS